ncbi:MAG: HD domain-containing protein [Bacilli bacterium]
MEFDIIIKDIVNNDNFKKLERISHHGVTRFDHSLMVAKYSYKISKALKLDYNSVTRGAMLHDFFFIDNKDLTRKDKLYSIVNHPKIAYNNAIKYFDINYLEEDIILSHMFPISLKAPRYIESWIVDMVDNVVAIKEKAYTIKRQLKTAVTFLLITVLNYM